MAIDPDALLIFQAREDESDDQKKKQAAKKEATSQTAIPAGTAELALPKPQPKPQQRRSQRKAAAQSRTTEQREEKQETLADTSIFRTDIPHTPNPTVNVYSSNEYISKKVAEGQGKAQMSREAARGRNCVWHPWREAFAICTYCHRPFCFEDTMEYGNEYYCLEDIDSASSTYKEKLASTGNTIGIASGILLMIGFITFFYFSNSQVAFVIGYLAKVGVPYFLMHLNYSYAFALIDSVLMVLALITAILVFTQSTRSYMLGILVCLISITVFSYQYISTFTTYLILLDAVMLLGFMTLLVSRTAASEGIDNRRLVSQSRNTNSNITRWPNVGRF